MHGSWGVLPDIFLFRIIGDNDAYFVQTYEGCNGLENVRDVAERYFGGVNIKSERGCVPCDSHAAAGGGERR